MTPEGRVVILDFGLIAELLPQHAGEASYVSGGTPAYMSPEEASGATPSEAGDWYSVGVTLYEALDGDDPVRGSSPDVLLRKRPAIRRRLLRSRRTFPPDLNAICMGLLCRDPEQRLSGAEVLRQLARDTATAGRGHRASADPRHAVRRPRPSASRVERGRSSAVVNGRARPCPSTARQASARARWSGYFLSGRRPRTMSSCSPAAATRTSRCLTRRSTE